MKKLLLIMCLLPTLALAQTAITPADKDKYKPDAKPVKADVDTLKADLKTKHKLKDADLTAALKTTDGKTRKELADSLKEWCKGLPKAGK